MTNAQKKLIAALDHNGPTKVAEITGVCISKLYKYKDPAFDSDTMKILTVRKFFKIGISFGDWLEDGE